MSRRKNEERRERAEAQRARKRAEREAKKELDATEGALRKQNFRRSKRGTLNHVDIAWAFANVATAEAPPVEGLSRYGQPLHRVLHADRPRAEHAAYRTLLSFVVDRAPRLVDETPALHRLWGVSMLEWVRPLDDWKPKGKSARTWFVALVTHLAVRYPIKPFLFSAFDSTMPAKRPYPLVQLFGHLAKGGSLHKAVRDGLLPVKMTKRMCHRFMQTTAGHTVVEAIRRAQALDLGADRRIAAALAKCRLGRALQAAEDFWFTVIQWLCNFPMLDPTQVGPLVDYITRLYEAREAAREQAREDAGLGIHGGDLPAPFSMKGRSAAAVFRGMEAWHGDLAHEAEIAQREAGIYGRRPIATKFEPSGIRAHSWQVKRGRERATWNVVELLTLRALSDEGKAMGHCVYSYGYSVSKGQISIWSLSLDGERALTVEVDNAQRQIVQARGLRNRQATNSELTALKRWGERAELALHV